jgi:hypothetical protein
MTTRQSEYLAELLTHLPPPDEAAADAVARRQARLTKPAGPSAGSRAGSGGTCPASIRSMS